LSLCLTEHHTMKAYLGSGGIAPCILITAGDRGDWSPSRPCRLTPRERALGTHWIGGWVGPGASLDALGKRKNASPCQDSNLRSSRTKLKIIFLKLWNARYLL